jgi:hypothetical protein
MFAILAGLSCAPTATGLDHEILVEGGAIAHAAQQVHRTASLAATWARADEAPAGTAKAEIGSKPLITGESPRAVARIERRPAALSPYAGVEDAGVPLAPGDSLSRGYDVLDTPALPPPSAEPPVARRTLVLAPPTAGLDVIAGRRTVERDTVPRSKAFAPFDNEAVMTAAGIGAAGLTVGVLTLGVGIDDADRGTAVFAGIATGVGVVGLATAGILSLVLDDESHESAADTTVQVTAAPGGIGARIEF